MEKIKQLFESDWPKTWYAWPEYLEDDKQRVYKKTLGTENAYQATIFIVRFSSKNELLHGWEKINDKIAVNCQSGTDLLIERSNYYLCLFSSEEIDEEIRKKIEENPYCTKKYLFKSNEDTCWDEIEEMVEDRIFFLHGVQSQAETKKIASLQVRNFRTFEGEPEPFDFCHKESGNPASLVMIHARNGSGKTSICDAIEWILTDDVGRLSKMEKDIGGSGMLLHNNRTHSTLAEYTESERAQVRLTVKKDINDDEIILTRTAGINKAGSRDLSKYGDKVVSVFKCDPANDTFISKNIKWSQSLLPHHMIESFISSTKPSDRFSEWMEFIDPDGKLQSNYKKSLTSLAKAKKELTAAEREFDKASEELADLKQEKESLDYLFSLIQNYNQFTKMELLQLSKDSDLNGYHMFCQKVGQSQEQVIERVKCVGSDLAYISVYTHENGKKFYQLLHDLDAAEKKLDELNANILGYLQYRKYFLLKSSQIEKRSKCMTELDTLRTIDEYGISRIRGLLSVQDDLKYKLPQYQYDLEADEKRLKKNQEQSLSLQIQLAEYERKEEELIRKKECLDILEKRYGKINTTFQSLMHSVDDLSLKQRNIDEQISVFNSQKSVLINQVFPSTISELTEKSIEKPTNWTLYWPEDEFFAFLKKKKKLYLKREKLQEQLVKEENQEAAISEFITIGRKYLEEHHTEEECECPFCHTSFSNTQALYQATLLLGKDYKEFIINQLSDNQKCLDNLDVQYQTIRKDIQNDVEHKINEIETELKKLTNLKEEYSNEVSKANAECNTLQKEYELLLNDISSRVQWNQTITFTRETFRDWCISTEKLLEQDKINTKKDLAVIEIENKQICNSIQTKKDVISELEEAKTIMNRDPRLLEVFDYISCFYEDESVRERKLIVQKELSLCVEEISNAEKGIAEYETFGIVDYEQCVVDQKQEENTCKQYRSVIAALKEKINFSSSEELSLNSLVTFQQVLIEELENWSTQRMMLTNIQSCNVSEYFRKYHDKEQLVEDKSRIKKESKKLFSNAKEHQKQEADKLEQKIKDYFSSALFNEIYKKIDPHPITEDVFYEIGVREQKNKKGETDYIPELRILAKNKQGDVFSPEWFFSTAQLNVVTLTAFLSRSFSVSSSPRASLLNMIMIDDPVGHFDDMNILDFSDMIRCIMEQTNKQIIITTHDETVFQIFRRKLPPEYYRSRFIRIGDASLRK